MQYPKFLTCVTWIQNAIFEILCHNGSRGEIRHFLEREQSLVSEKICLLGLGIMLTRDYRIKAATKTFVENS